MSRRAAEEGGKQPVASRRPQPRRPSAAIRRCRARDVAGGSLRSLPFFWQRRLEKALPAWRWGPEGVAAGLRPRGSHLARPFHLDFGLVSLPLPELLPGADAALLQDPPSGRCCPRLEPSAPRGALAWHGCHQAGEAFSLLPLLTLSVQALSPSQGHRGGPVCDQQERPLLCGVCGRADRFGWSCSQVWGKKTGAELLPSTAPEPGAPLLGPRASTKGAAACPGLWGQRGAAAAGLTRGFCLLQASPSSAWLPCCSRSSFPTTWPR